MAYYDVSRIVRESAPLLFVLIIIEVLGGNLIHTSLEYSLFPVLLVLVPLVNSLGGNIGGIFGARMSSGLHLGTITRGLRGRELHENVLAVLILGAICFSIAPFLVWILAPFMGIGLTLPFWKLFLISFLTGAILLFMIIIIGISVSFSSYKMGMDPDNVVIPILTTGVDFFGMVCLVFVVAMIGS